MGIPPTIEGTLKDFDNAEHSWIKGKDSSTISGVGPIKFAAHIIRQQQAEIERLREALSHYGNHANDCNLGTIVGGSVCQQCTCGFTALLGGVTDETEASR